MQKKSLGLKALRNKDYYDHLGRYNGKTRPKDSPVEGSNRQKRKGK